MKAKFLLSCLFVLTSTLFISACGKKGGPFPPEGGDNVYPRQYPKPEK